MKFSSLDIKQWCQFENISLKFHDRTTILTGANGAGKSTILRILSQHFGWNSTLLGTPKRSKDGIFRYLYRKIRHELLDEATSQAIVGTVAYSNGNSAPIIIPASSGAIYNTQIQGQQPVEGLFISSHRPVLNYQVVNNIPTSSISAQQAYQQYSQEIMNKYNNSFTQFSPTYRMKEAIISMATFGPGNKNLQSNPELEQVFDDFEQALRAVLPKSLGFQRLVVRIPDIVIITTSGEFILDAASGGIMSLIDLTWQVFLYSRGKAEFVVVLDEPENHLHPSMQRAILQSLVAAFPKAQFVVATHSPFVVSSVRDALVYVLQYTNSDNAQERSVNSVLLDQFSRAGTAGDILREALGVPVTMPMWAEDELKSITSEFRLDELNEEKIALLRERLRHAGLEEFYPDALSHMAR